MFSLRVSRSTGFGGLEEESVVFTPLRPVNKQPASLYDTFEGSSGFDENFPTSEYPHLPAWRCELSLLLLLLRSFLEACIYT